MLKIIIKISILFLFISQTAFSQTEQDTTSNVQTDEYSFEMEKSPWGAVLRSAVLPGLGQFYNESYWKVPVIWGIIGYFGYVWLDNNDSYKTYRDLYIESDYSNNNYKDLRNFYKDQRDEFAIYIGLTYFLQLVDAYVDAHLFDFNVTPDPITKQPQLGIKFYIR